MEELKPREKGVPLMGYQNPNLNASPPGRISMIKEMYRRIMEEGGFTYSMCQKRFLGKEDNGFIVSDGDSEDILYTSDPSMSPERIMDFLGSFITENILSLAREGYFIGAWLNEGKYLYLDVNRKYSSKNRALEVARKGGQKAIYDLRKQENIYL